MKSKCILFLAFSLTPLLIRAQARHECADISSAVTGNLIFGVNDSVYKMYPNRYKIKICDKKGPTVKFVLEKGASNNVPKTIDPKRLGDYCIQIKRRRVTKSNKTTIFNKRIGWGDARTAFLFDGTPVRYLASLSRSPELLGKKITSQDGNTGDGVKVLVD
jgi:hypothetical protein